MIVTVRKKAMISFEGQMLEKLDAYAKEWFMDNRSMAVHHILKEFFADKKKGD